MMWGPSMPRGAPSRADRALIDGLAEQGVRVSPSQLERWRHAGLLPRVRVVREGWGGSEVPPHPSSVVEAAAVLAQYGRGRSWEAGGIELFALGFALSESALRDCADWLARRAF